MERAILARHGESVFNVLDVMNGDPDLPGGLTHLGREQAAALGMALRGERLDLCVTSEFERARATADEALAGRDVPRLVSPALNDPLYGPYEGKLLEDYRAWAWANPATSAPGEGGESRVAIVERYARVFRELIARPEETLLVVAHSLPIAYALGARDGQAPAARVPFAGNAVPYPFTAKELESAAGVLEGWVAAPGW
ncbi:MAG TPA: histidine phosphatase family protein [Gaiellaceae bacterium]|nr:histidine phosphatase family protein [Gaiellaceae bacterium]